jgi:hypothetical protein
LRATFSHASGSAANREFPPPGARNSALGPALFTHQWPEETGSNTMARYGLLWLLGVPIPILILIWLFGGLN